MKHLRLLLCMILLSALNCHATVWQKFKIDNLNYQVLSEDASTMTGTVTVWDGGMSGDLVIPSHITYNGFDYTVKEIQSEYYIDDDGEIEDCDGEAFYESEITSVVIPNTIEKIGSYAFSGCPELTTVNIPASVTIIESGIFSECANLTTITVDTNNPVFDSRNNCNAIIETASNTLIQGCNVSVIPETVTSIGRQAFYGCSGFTSINIPNNVSTIGSYAFGNCSNLSTVNIGSGVTNINIYSFGNSNNLNYINIDPDNSKYDSRDNCNAVIETATNSLFLGCKNSTIPNTVTSIGEGAFNNISGLTNIVIPGNVTTLGKRSFLDCTNLSEVTLENGVVTIGEDAFRNDRNLTSIDIPNSVTTIGEYALDIYQLKEIHVHWSSPKKLTNDITTNYNNTTLIVPDGTVDKYKKASYWKKFKTIINESDTEEPETIVVGSTFVIDGLKYTVLTLPSNTNPGTVYVTANSTSLSGNVVIPEQVTEPLTTLNKTFTVTNIPKQAFQKCINITEVTIPNTVTSIGTQAFYHCIELQTVQLPDNLTVLETSTFCECYKLQSITLPETITAINSTCFQNCYALSGTLTIPASVITIGSNAFRNCGSLNEIVFNEGLERIEDDAFSNNMRDNTTTSTITIPASVSYIGRNFVHYKNLSNIFVDDNNSNYCDLDGVLYTKDLNTIIKYPPMKDIEEEYVLPEEIKTISDNCFEYSKIKSLVLPDTMDYIGEYAFDQSVYLKNIKMPEYLIEMGKRAFSADDFNYPDFEHLEYLKLPAGITTIPDDCFLGRRYLRVFKIPNSVKIIGETILETPDSHYDLPMVHITLPTYFEGMCYQPGMEKSAGHECSLFGVGSGANIKEITLPKSTKHIGHMFSGLNTGEFLHNNGSGYVRAVYVIGDELPNVSSAGNLYSINNQTVPDKATIYFKKSVYFDKYSDGTCTFPVVDSPESDGGDYTFNADYRIPISMTNASGNPIEFKTLCRDFDVDLTHTNDNLPEGVEPLRAYLVDDVDGELRKVFMNEIKYIPSRLKANVTDENGNLYEGVDEYVGVILRGTPGYTYYYEMGEHDYTQGAEGQWLMDEAMAYSNSIDTNNMLAGDANDEFYVYKTVEDKDNNEIVNYGLNANKFKIYHKDGWLNYNKAYLQLPKDVSAAIEGNTDAEGNANLTFVFNNADGTTDKVSSVEFNRNCESDIFYNPYGQRVNANTKGIVINNGKKYVNK